MKKKTISAFLILFMMLFILAPVRAEVPHPDPNSGNPFDYDGKWIIDGTTEDSTTWTLELNAEDGSYKLYNEHQSFEGDWEFIPGNKKGTNDTIKLDFDPELGIDVVLENAANGLIDVSGQGLIFVRPGNKANIEEAEELEHYPPEKMVGDWIFRTIAVSVGDFNFELTAEEALGISGTDEKELILSLKDGVLSYVSSIHQYREPIVRYRWIGRNMFTFKFPYGEREYYHTYLGFIFGDKQQFMAITAYPAITSNSDVMMHFDRIKGLVVPSETEGD